MIALLIIIGIFCTISLLSSVAEFLFELGVFSPLNIGFQLIILICDIIAFCII